jgi:hypothetical protein
MIRKVLLFLGLALISTGSLYAQKVKYKDLIVLLTARDFEKAEPFLKRYLKETVDNPNAFLYMGIIYQDKSTRLDVLTRTDAFVATVDSALLFYDKAYKTIDEKELKKNDEYYEAYTRRDLRTGKFVVKLSDVRLDIETRTKDIKDKKENVKNLRAHLTAATKAYEKSAAAYKSIQDKYEGEREFFLRSDDELIEQLKKLITVFDSVNVAFTQYKSVSRAVGKTGYNQVINLQNIKDFKKDGAGGADFLKDDLKLWDYKTWATQSMETIQKEIVPMRQNLIAYDIEINKLRDKLKADSVSVKNDMAKLISKILNDQLKKYDQDPMPLNVFDMKMAELEYGSNRLVNKALRDSASLHARLTALKTEISDLSKIDSLASHLLKRDFETEEKNYAYFVSKAFGRLEVLKSLASSMQDFAEREKLKRQKEFEKVNQSLNWLTVESDSIPLFSESGRDLKFKPIIIEKEKYTLGLMYKDTLATGYFYSITPSRKPDIKANFAVAATSFTKSKFPLAKGLTTSDDKGQVYFVLIYSTEKKGEKFNATLAKIYRSDGLAWQSDLTFDLLPSEITYSVETAKLSVKQTGTDGSTKLVQIDKNGKLIP